jgi:UDP:flavonoid glycosyltransferase YjiC (YdhE family)
MFYPKDPTKLLAFIEELLNMDVPFLWSHASLFTTIPDELVARIEASAFAHHASWVPQRAVLAHPATMWFVSHGGWNSVQEALGLRVPM